MPRSDENINEQFSILIVEDDDETRHNMEDILSLDGYRTKSVSHCLPAISAVESEEFDAVIVDWCLPDGDGGHLIPMLLRSQPNTPVVVVTGQRQFEMAVTALRKGAHDFLVKPINTDVLRSVLDRLVERKLHLGEIETAEGKLVESERLAAIGQMVAGLAHESRNAFQRSYACLDELSLDLGGLPQSLELVRKIEKAVDDIRRLLDDVREYSAPISLTQDPYPIDLLIIDVWKELIQSETIESMPSFALIKSEDFPAECFVDADRIQRVSRSLLENAIFASARPGNVQVELKYTDITPRRIRIEISDDGDGVMVEKQELIFRPFFTTKTHGTGLGLAISKRIVEAHKGSLFVESSDLGGARFVIELPCP